MSCLDNTDILRIVGGNSFQIAITVKARRVADGSEIEDFDLSASSPVLNLIHAGEKTRKYFVTQGNQAIISFDGSEGLGYYGMEMSGSYNSEAWRFCIEKVLQLVDTNAKANIPEWSVLVDDTYFIEGTISIYGGGGGGDTVQADWTETNPTSAAFILHKPDLSVYATKTEVASGLAGKQDTVVDLTSIRYGAAAGATAYQKPSSGIPESDMSEGVQTSLGKADSSYQKPSSGIPSTDMSEGVQAALEKANSAVQTETDPVFSNSPAAEISQNDINSWNAKQSAIADLADIREGAAAGATAVQPDEMAQAIDEVDGDIADINAKIPTAASNLNQLADKAYVNSSIATNSATYRGSFNLITDLGMNVDATHAQIAGALATAITTADNNDYAFVQIPDSASTPTVIAKIERYKHNGSGWVYEYDLNNSGFTSAQWAAINSGITSGLVGKLADLPNNSELATLLNGKQNVINDLSAIRSGASAGATAVQPADLTEALNDVEDEIAGLDESKQDTIEDLSTIRSGAAAGATAYQKPASGIPESDMSDGVQSALDKADSAYQKPSSGIPATDMSESVRAALEKANSAVQTETDPVFSNSPAAEISQNDINSWNAKQSAIGDLADIREGAAAGATAVQPDEMAQAIDGVEGDIEDINAKIPTAASSLNQLADKAYVNSSIATNSATYRGSFNLITDLGMNVDATHAQIAGALGTAIVTADNNDYAFVQIPDSASTPTVIAKIERYKHNGTGWVYEYDLNNSGFTAAQWAAINSGITSGLVGKLADLPNNSELATLLNGKQNVINDLSAIRSGASAGATAVQPADLTEALNGVEAEIAGLDESKQDVIEDLSAIRSGAAAGATAYQKPASGIPESDMSEGVQSALDKADSAYQKPSSGIPATDMSDGVQASLEKANSAVQTETDPVFSGSPAAEITQADINNWNAKQPTIADLADIREGAAAGATAVQPDEMAQAIDEVDGDIADINAKIPTAASNLNQLADKAYVNSSIATNSATYRGSFNLITDLGMNVDATHAQIAGALATAITTADNNDYAFVQIPDSASTPTVIAKIERYKHNGSGWVYEYDLNNSGFTAAQWAAINSGITSGLVGKLADLPNNSELATLLNGKQNVINDLSAIRSGAAAGATAIQPADLTEALSDLPTADNEDIHVNSSNKYQLMNRGTSDGMGYIIVRKGSSLSSQMNQTNTIYEIRYDFDLGNAELTVPNESTLRFEGGSLSNGTLNLNNCYLEGSPLITCEISGNIKNSKYYATWFGVKADGVTDDYIAFQKAVSINKDNILSIEDIKNNIMLSESVSFNIGSSQHKKHLVGNGTFGLKPLTDYDVSSGALLSIEESSYIIDNVPFYGYPDDKTQTALKLEGRCQDIIIRACLFIYFDTAIEYSTNSCYNHIEDCIIYYAKYGFKIPDRDSSSKWCGAIDINNTKINECEYGVYLSGYFSSVCFKGGYLEGCKYKLYVSSSYTTNSSALFTNNYWADESAECIIIGGGTITIETPSSAIAGAYTVDYVDVDKTNKHYTAIVNGGKMKLLNAFFSNSVNGEKANSAAISVGENGLVDIINVRYASGRSYGTSVIDFPAEKNIKFLETIPSYTLNGTFAKGKSPFTTNINGAGLYNGYTIRCGVEVLEDSNGYGGNIIRLAKSDTSHFAAAIPFHVPHLGRYAIRYKIRRNIKNSPCINFSGGTTASDLTGLYYLSSKSWYGYSVLPADLSGTDIMAEGCIPIDVTDEFGYICINNYMGAAAAADTYFDVYYLCLVDSSNDTKIANFADAFEKSGKGTTAKRPVLTGIGTDFQYLDEDLGKPIWWNGTNWVDATGSSV